MNQNNPLPTPGVTSRPVLLACDGAYGMQLATTLLSIVDANRSGEPIEFHVLVDGVPEATRSAVHRSLPPGSASIRWIPADIAPFRAFGTWDYISTMTFARFLIPSVFPEEVRRVIYLDTDVLVLSDLKALWETDLQGHPVGAVRDHIDAKIKSNEPEFAGVPRVGHYFNAGVLLIDLPGWRRERISERALEYLASNPQSPYSDQDALNVACDGRWTPLDPRWNFVDHTSNRVEQMPAPTAPRIVHFVTSQKPWKPSSLSVNAQLYDSYRRRTCFARDTQAIFRDFIETQWYKTKRPFRRYKRLRALWQSLDRNRLIADPRGQDRVVGIPSGR